MRHRGLLAALVALPLLFAASVRSAQAGQVLFDNAGFLRGQQSFVESFDIEAPGTLTVTLSNIDWPAKLASLSMILSSTNGFLTPQMGEGTVSFELTQGRYFAQWFGKAQGALDIGVYAMRIEFQPSAVPVPLPTSVALLLSGLALLSWQRRQRSLESGEVARMA